MAYGGGNFQVQNKYLPGYYYKFLSAGKYPNAISERGKVAVGLALDWGTDEKIVSLSSSQFKKESVKYFGYDSGSEKLTPIRELFANATQVIFYRLNGGGTKATCKWATAKCTGIRGNDITIVIAGAIDEPGKFDIFTYLKDERGNSICKDKQRVTTLDDVVDNDFVEFKRTSNGVCGVYRLDILTALSTGDSLKIGEKTYTYSSAEITTESQAQAIVALYSGDTEFDVIAVGDSVIFTQKTAGTGAIPVIDVTGVKNGSVKISTITDGVNAGTAIELIEDAGTALIGGTNGVVTGSAHQDFLIKLERVHYHCLACNSTDEATIALYINYQKRLSHDCGKVAQCVVYGYSIKGNAKTEIKPDSYDIIVVENAVTTVGVPEHYGIFWVAGAEAGCAVNKTVQNRIYNGEYDLFVDYTQDELALKLNKGKFVFHETINTEDVSEVRVLDDVNSFVTTTEDENEKYKKNQLIRVLYQIIFDIGGLFNTKWQGVTPNDADGRSAFKGVICKYLLELENNRAIQGVSIENIIVEQGETENSVYIAIPVNGVVAMFQCYNDITVG